MKYLNILILIIINLIIIKSSIISQVNIPYQLNYNGNDNIVISGYNIPRYYNGEMFTNFQMEFSNGTIYNFNTVNVNYSNETQVYQYEFQTPRGFGNGQLKVFITNNTQEKLISQNQFKYQLPNINSITLVSPRYGGVVTVSGNGFFESIVNINVLDIIYPCSNIQINSDATVLTCEIGQIVNVIDADYYTLQLESGKMVNTTFDRFSFLPWSKTCPNQCSNNGYCDSQLNCICNENYESFDCSIKVNTNQYYPNSNLTNLTTFKMFSPNSNFQQQQQQQTTKDQEEFSIKVISFRRLNYYGFVKNQYPIEVLANVQQSISNDGFMVSGSAPTVTDMFESLEFDGNFYLNSNESPEHFINEHGYNLTLPTSRNSAIINLLATGITLNDYDTDSFQFVFEISINNNNNGLNDQEKQQLNATMDLNQVIKISSNNINSILEFTPYYYSFSLSNNVSQDIDRSPIVSKILTAQDAQSIYGYNENSIYIAVETKPQYEMLMVDASFNLYKNINPINSNDNNNNKLLLKVFLPIGVFVIVSVIGLSIFIIKRRNNNQSNNYNNFKKLINSNDNDEQKEGLLNSNDIYDI